MRGKMIWFNEDKNHGFISTDEGERLYVHGSGFADAPPVGPCNGLVVEFYIAGDEERGRRAEGARIILEPAQRRARRRGSR